MADTLPFDPRASEQRFQLLINAVTDYAIYMLEPTGHIVTWNSGARRFKGYEAEEIIGRHFSAFFTDEDRAAELPARILRTAAEEGRFESEGWRVRKDGTRFWAQVVVDPIHADDGALIGFAKVTRDVTERREAERSLYESEQRFRMLVQGVRDYAIYMLDPDGTVSNWNAGAESLNQWDIQVNRLWSSRLCSIDTVQLIDQGSHSYSGTVFLGEFVPYQRVRTSDAR